MTTLKTLLFSCSALSLVAVGCGGGTSSSDTAFVSTYTGANYVSGSSSSTSNSSYTATLDLSCPKSLGGGLTDWTETGVVVSSSTPSFTLVANAECYVKLKSYDDGSGSSYTPSDANSPLSVTMQKDGSSSTSSTYTYAKSGDTTNKYYFIGQSVGQLTDGKVTAYTLQINYGPDAAAVQNSTKTTTMQPTTVSFAQGPTAPTISKLELTKIEKNNSTDYDYQLYGKNDNSGYTDGTPTTKYTGCAVVLKTTVDSYSTIYDYNTIDTAYKNGTKKSATDCDTLIGGKQGNWDSYDTATQVFIWANVLSGNSYTGYTYAIINP